MFNYNRPKSKVISVLLSTLLTFSVISPSVALATSLDSRTKAEARQTSTTIETKTAAEKASAETNIEAATPTETTLIPTATEATAALEPAVTETVPQATEVEASQTSPEIAKQEKAPTPSKASLHVKSLDSVKLTSDFVLEEAKEITLEQKEELANFFRQSLFALNDNYTSSEADGTKINTLTIKWLTVDSKEFAPADNSQNLLSLVWPTNDEQKVQAQIDFSLSGQKDYPPYTFTLKIPKYIFKNRFKQNIGKMNLSVPAAPDGSQVFAYVEEEDCYKIVNTRLLQSSSVGSFQLSISELIPKDIVDHVKNYKTDNLNAELTIKMHKDTLIGTKTDDLQVQVDTQAELIAALKRANKVYEEWQDDFPSELKPAEPDKYIYAKWVANATSRASQPFKVNYKDEATSSNSTNSEVLTKPIVLGYQLNYGNRVIKNIDNTGNTRNEANQDSLVFSGYINDGNNFYTTIYTAYLKSEFKEGNTYKLTNKGTFTLTSEDDQAKTEQTATAELEYTPISFKVPTGHFYVHKYGAGQTVKNRSNKPEGIYEGALNYLRDKKDTEVTYRVRTEGFGMPWTLDPSLDNSKIESYFKKAYTMTVKDEDVHLEDGNLKLTAGTDYIFTKLLFKMPEIYDFVKYKKADYGYKENVNGSTFDHVSYEKIPQGEWGYKLNEQAEMPEFKVYCKVQGESDYKQCATVKFVNGEVKLAIQNGASTEEDSLIFPENTLAYKVEATTKKAALIWQMYPTIKLLASDSLQAKVNQLFANSDTPMMRVKNTVDLNVHFEKDNSDKFINSDFANDELLGVGYGAVLKKTVDYTNDTSNNLVKLHYTIKANVQTNVSNKDKLAAFVKDKIIEEQKEGIFYDLLPQGLVVDKNSISLREHDSIEDIQFIPNYKNSKRTLMIVKAKLTPQYKLVYNSADQAFDRVSLADQLELTFDAIYSWDDYHEFGQELVNYAVYESANERLGTMKGYKGEPDDPTVGNNLLSNYGALGQEETLKDLNKEHNKPSFIYAKNTVKLSVDVSSLANVKKLVDVNDEGWFSDGHNEDKARNVYEGGTYTYKISVKNDKSTKSNEIKLIDYLENHIPGDDVPEVYKDTTFKGLFEGVDTSRLKAMGINPVVYYATKELTDVTKTVDLTDTATWSTTMPSDMHQVRAIAIDCSKKTDGSSFTLDVGGSLVAFVKMRAPMVADLTQNNDNAKWYDKVRPNGKNEYDDTDQGLAYGAHAYNGIIMQAKTSKDGNQSELLQTYNKFTKVGLKPYHVTVEKHWDDDNDSSCKRPESITVKLLANDKEINKTASLNKDNNWQHKFENLPYQDKDGKKIRYTVKEDPVPTGYILNNLAPREVEDGVILGITNYLAPETITIKGTKTWRGRQADKVTIDLLADGNHVKSTTISADPEGKWHYEFTDLSKFKKNVQGQCVPINYSVREANSDDYKVKYDGYNIENTFYPYADISLRKELTDAAKLAGADKKFAFKVTILDKSDKENDDTYELVITNTKTKEETKSHVSSGSVINLSQYETALIKKVPMGFKYKFTEDVPQGYILLQNKSRNLEGVVRRNAELSGDLKALAVNTYEANGKIFIKGKKTLTNRKLEAYQFMFDVYDQNGNLYSSASNDPDGNINFGYFTYSVEDANKEHSYTIKERNLKQAGYTYDAKKKTLKIKVTDNHDGTLKVEATSNLDDITFNNEYKAQGKLKLQALKKLAGTNSSTPLKDKMQAQLFKFVLKDSNDKQVATATNDENGIINFSEIDFSQKDIGKTYTYTASELVPKLNEAGYDDYIYDTTTCTYTVTIKDMGDGTLGFDVVTKDKHTTDINNNANIAVFVNRLKAGSLTLTKAFDTTNGADYSKFVNKDFKFKIKFKGDEIPKNVEIERKYYDPKTKNVRKKFAFNSTFSSNSEEDISALHNSAAEVETVPNVPNSPKPLLSLPSEDLAIAKDTPTSTANNTTAELAGAKATLAKAVMTFNALPMSSLKLRSATSSLTLPVSGKLGAYEWGEYTIDENWHMTIKLANNVSSYILEPLKWKNLGGNGSEYCKHIKSITIEKGVKLDNRNEVFATLSSLEELTFTSNDFLAASSVSRIFKGAPYLKKITFPNESFGANVTNFERMFEGRENLKTIVNLDKLDTSNATSMFCMFNGCKKLKSIDLSNFNTANVKDMSYMFRNCEGLEQIVGIDKWKTGLLYGITYMFDGCKKLVALDLKGFNVANVSSFACLFANCSSLKTLSNIQNWSTSNAEYMDRVFLNCKQLQSINLSNWNTKNVTTMEEMFAHCCGLEELDLANFKIDKRCECNNMLNLLANPSASSDAQHSLQKITFGKNISKLTSAGLPNPKKDVITTSGKTTGLWIKEDRTSNAMTGEELCSSYQPNMAGTYICETVQAKYTIKFAKNLAEAQGTMADIRDVAGDKEITIPACNFSSLNYKFLKWSTKADANAIDAKFYKAGTTVKNITSEQEITLYAIWEKLNNKPTIANNELEVTLKANQALTLKNLPANLKYAIYEETDEGFVLVQQTNESGVISSNKDSQADFVNAYNPNQITALLGGTKLLDGKEAANYQFQLLNAEGTVVDTATSKENGTFNFKLQNYTEEGTYTYTIKEVADPNDKNVIYASNEEQVTVTVTKENGVLQAKVNRQIPDVKFNNTSKMGSLKIVKKLTNVSTSDATFNAKVTLSTGEVKELSLSSQNNYTETLNNIPLGTTYKVEEYDVPEGYELEKIVNAEGEIKDSANVITVTIKNRAKIQAGSVNVVLTKTLEGRDLVAGEFSFELYELSKAENGTEIRTKLAEATNDKTGKIDFGAVKLTRTGQYTWIAKEVKGKDPNITYDDKEIKITFAASLNGNNITAQNVTYDPSEKTFTNKNTPPKPEKKGKFSIKKTVENPEGIQLSDAAKAKQFTLHILLEVLNSKTNAYEKLLGKYEYQSSSDTNVHIFDASKDTITIKHDETITFKDIPDGTKVTVTEAKTDGYSLDESKSTLEGVVKGKEVKKKDEDNSDSGGFIIGGEETEPEPDDNDDALMLKLNLVNKHEAKGEILIKGTKTLIGHSLKGNSFDFLLLKDGKEEQRVNNNEKGEISFKLAYSLKDVGTHKYTIVEEKGDDQQFIYDRNKFDVDVTVTDTKADGTLDVQAKLADDKQLSFTNRYRHKLPTTGKEHLIIASVIGGALLLLALYLVKRREDKEC